MLADKATLSGRLQITTGSAVVTIKTLKTNLHLHYCVVLWKTTGQTLLIHPIRPIACARDSRILLACFDTVSVPWLLKKLLQQQAPLHWQLTRAVQESLTPQPIKLLLHPASTQLCFTNSVCRAVVDRTSTAVGPEREARLQECMSLTFLPLTMQLYSWSRRPTNTMGHFPVGDAQERDGSLHGTVSGQEWMSWLSSSVSAVSTQVSSCSCDSTELAVLRSTGTPAAAWWPGSPIVQAVSGRMPTLSMSSMLGVRYLQIGGEENLSVSPVHVFQPPCADQISDSGRPRISTQHDIQTKSKASRGAQGRLCHERQHVIQHPQPWRVWRLISWANLRQVLVRDG